MAKTAPVEQTMKDRWWYWHCHNKHVYKRFEIQVYRAIRQGKMKISAYAIMNWIRWEIYMETEGDEYLINNNWIPFYARYFAHLHPEHKEIFNLRTGIHVTQ